MAPFNPIGDAGRTLRSLLYDGLSTWGVSEEQVALTSPEGFEPEEPGLSIHLYRLAEDTHHSKGGPAGTDLRGATQLVLELNYLITAHPPSGGTADTSDTLEQHRLLSKAIQTLEANRVVRPPDLLGALANGGSLQLTMDTDAETRMREVWGSFTNTPYLPSVSYGVSPVVIELPAEGPAPRVIENTMEHVDATEDSDAVPSTDDTGRGHEP